MKSGDTRGLAETRLGGGSGERGTEVIAAHDEAAF